MEIVQLNKTVFQAKLKGDNYFVAHDFIANQFDIGFFDGAHKKSGYEIYNDLYSKCMFLSRCNPFLYKGSAYEYDHKDDLRLWIQEPLTDEEY